MRTIFFLIACCFVSVSFSQSLSEGDIKKLAARINNELKGTDLGSGVTIRGCLAYGRTLVYLYDVFDEWSPEENMKEQFIANTKEAGISDDYFNNNINVELQYYYGNRLRKRITIKSNEFSDLNFSLGDYISIRGHPKAKGVNLKIKKPIGWELKEGDRPNIVMIFTYEINSYMIMVKDNITFFSKNESGELFRDDEYVREMISETNSFLKDAELINKRVVTIDSYPSFEFTIKGQLERSEISLKMKMKFWVIYYEDKIVFLLCNGLDNREFSTLEGLFNLMTNSVIFPDQYN